MARTEGFLKGTVGAGDFDNRRDDVIALKRRLHALGLYEPPPEGFGDDIDAGFDRALRAFQEKHGLRVDGYSAPGGETERNVEAVRTGRGFDPGPDPDRLALEGSVGDGGDNRPADVVLVKRALGAAGLYPYDRTRPPSPYVDTKLVEAIAALERDHDLFESGRIDTDDETAEALRRVLGNHRPGAADAGRVAVEPGKRRSWSDGPVVPSGPRPGGPLTTGSMRRIADAIDRRLEARQSNGAGEHPDDPGGVVDAEAWFRRHIAAFKRRGSQTAAANLEHYLSGEGTPKMYTADEMRAFAPIRRLERKAHNAFTGETFLARRGPDARKLEELETGAAPIRFTDLWTPKAYEKEFIRQMLTGEQDFALAFGKTSIKSNGEFVARRVDDTIRIEGTVTHTPKDPYNFDKENQPGYTQGAILEKHGEAKPFDIEAQWRQWAEGSVKVIGQRKTGDGRTLNILGEPQFEWIDLPAQ